MIRDVILKYYGIHTCFDTVSCYLDGVDNKNPTILDMNGDRKPIYSVLAFKDHSYWTVKFLYFSQNDIDQLLNTLIQKPFISVLHIDEPFSSIIPGETKIPYVCDGEEESELVQQGKINLSQCVQGELFLEGQIKDIYFDEDENKRGIEIINYTEIIKDWRKFVKRETGYCEHYGTEFKSFEDPEVTIVFSNGSGKTYTNINEVKRVIHKYKVDKEYNDPKKIPLTKIETEIKSSLLELIFDYTTSKISQNNFINKVHKLTNLEKDAIRDLSGSMPIYKDEKNTSINNLGQQHTFNIETNTFEPMDYRHSWEMIFRWMLRYKLGQISRLGFGNGTNWVLIDHPTCSMDTLDKIKVVETQIHE